MLQLHFSPFPDLSTERLLLRQLKMKDAAEIFALRSDKRMNEFIDRPLSTKMEEAEEFITKINTGIEKGESWYWAIGLKNEDKLIGTICLWNFDMEKTIAELGYELKPEYQGLGIMSEAVERMIDFGFNSIELKIMTAVVRTMNYKSIYLLEKKGFVKDINNVISDELLGEGYELYYLKKK